jgi:hypothetical protein
MLGHLFKVKVSENLSSIFSALKSNFDSVLATTYFPEWHRYALWEYSRLVRQAIEDSNVDLTDDDRAAGRTLPDHIKVKARIDARLQNRRTQPTPHLAGHEVFMIQANLGELVKWRATRGTVIAVRSMLNSMISGSWTAFETAATDLWIHAVNACPTTLGAKAWQAKGWRDEGAEGPTTSSASVPIQLLRDHDFNLSGIMGTLIHRQRKFNFNRLIGIRQAYGVTFDQSSSKIFSDSWLSGLELMRNLIVHKAGRVDAVFLDEVARQKAFIFPDQNLNEPLYVDADQVFLIVTHAAQLAVSLCQYIDNWLTNRTT